MVLCEGSAARWQRSPKRLHSYNFTALNAVEMEQNTRTLGPPPIFSFGRPLLGFLKRAVYQSSLGSDGRERRFSRDHRRKWMAAETPRLTSPEGERFARAVAAVSPRALSAAELPHRASQPELELAAHRPHSRAAQPARPATPAAPPFALQ